MRVLIYGITGKMGRSVASEIKKHSCFELIGGISRNKATLDNMFIFNSLDDVDAVDLIIDFSHYSNLKKIIDYSVLKKVALVLGTTGYSEADFLAIKDASRHIPIIYSENFSLGINTIINSLNIYLKNLKDFEIEILEKHHKEKLDAPSGTAKRLIREIKKFRGEEIKAHCIRSSNIGGEHSIFFFGEDEEIEIKHKITSKLVFARGAIKAAKYIMNKQYGLYTIFDLGEDEK